MAFVSNSSPDQDPNQNPTGQNPLSQQAPLTSAPNASGAGKATGQPSNAGPSQPFTNLSAYLNANGPQLQAEGQQIASGLNTQYGQVTGDINSANANFNSQVNAGYTPMSQPTLDSFSANPTAVANDPTQAAAFKGMYGDSYKGPANFESTPDYLNLSGEVQNATTNAQNLQTPQGVQGYFSATSPTYTQGMGTLDASLLQGNPEVVSNIQAAAAPFTSLPGYLTSAVTTNDAAAQAANQQAQAAKTAAQGAYTKVAEPFSKTLNDQFTQAQQKAAAYNTQLNDATGKVGSQDFASLTPDEQKLIGYDPAVTSLIQQYPGIFPTQAQNNPINFSNFYQNGAIQNMPTPSDTVTPDQIAEYQALTSLSGNSPLTNFDMPTASTAGNVAPPASPVYKGQDAAAAILGNYNNIYTQAYPTGSLSQSQKDYMNSLFAYLNKSNPVGPTPPPTDGGGLGPGRGGV